MADTRLPAPPVRPAYDGAWLGAIVPALLADERPGWMPTAVAGAESVVLLVVDGLGWNIVSADAPDIPELRAMDGGPITTCAPSTTAAGLTSMSTGVPPGRHGICGYHLHTPDGVLEVLSWTIPGRVPPAPESLQVCPPFGGRPVPVVSRAEFRNTGFTKAYLRGSRLVGWSTTAVLVEHTRRLVAAGEGFVTAYYDGVDKVAHGYGLEDGFFTAEARATDRLVGDLLDVLPPTCALLVTADHGHVHLAATPRRSLDAVARWCAAFSGDARCRYLHATPGRAGTLAAAAAEAYGDEAWVMTRDEFVDDGWLGPEVRDRVIASVGDVVVAAHAPVIYPAPDHPGEGDLRAHHGSFTADEMLVPLLAARGRGPRD